MAEPKSFVKDTAGKTGMSERKVSEEVQIATNIIPEAQAVLKARGMFKNPR